VCGVRQDFKANGSCAQSVGSGASQSPPGRTAPVVFEQTAHAVHAWQDVEGEGARLRVEGQVELTTPLADVMEKWGDRPS
jgi:hypothetical protein